MDALVAAASAVLGRALADPVDLGGSERSKVLRCRDPAGGSVVVKSYARMPEGASGFAAQASGLAFTCAAGVGPRLLGADPAVPLVVMTDLGDAPSLADLLLAWEHLTAPPGAQPRRGQIRNRKESGSWPIIRQLVPDCHRDVKTALRGWR